MMDARKTIEQIKNDYRLALQSDAVKYKHAIIREIDYFYRRLKATYPDIDFNKLADTVFNDLNVPRSYKNLILGDLRDAQGRIAEVWNNYFHNLTASLESPVTKRDTPFIKGGQFDYEKLLASYSVDFPKINKAVRETVKSEFQQAARADYGFETIRTNLLKSKTIDQGQTYTLANTACAQFDNASMFELSLQAGINEFKYDGILHPNSREFCKWNLGKIFTYEQILKLDNGQGIPVLTSCGGYNCTHYWTAVITNIFRRVAR